jgi:hypothetical protein
MCVCGVCVYVCVCVRARLCNLKFKRTVLNKISNTIHFFGGCDNRIIQLELGEEIKLYKTRDF